MKKIVSYLACFLVIIANIQAQEWIQIGNNVEGEASGDRSGYSVVLTDDGMFMVIGAPYNDDIGLNAGHARVFENISGAWTQIGQNINGEAAGDNFGISVSINSDGSVIAVGGYNNNGNGSSAGHVRVYEYISGTWTQIGQDIDGEAAGDRSGASVCLSSDGSLVAIGAYGNDDIANNAGHVRVYKNQSGAWTQIGQDINGAAENDKFGESVSLSSDGTIVAVGGPYNDNSILDAGHVRVFENQAGTWTQVGAAIDGIAEEEGFGASVCLSSDGSILAAGALGTNDYSGCVRVYENQSGTWTQIGQSIEGTGDYAEFGSSVSLNSSGSFVAIGAPFNSENGSEAGLVGMYEYQSGIWTQVGQTILGAAADDELGTSISLSADGAILAIGSPYSDSNELSVGHVGVFELHFPPAINNQPEDQTNICPESNVSFTVSGENIETYQWQVDEGGGFIDIANGAIYNNANTATLSISGVTLGMNNNQYRCVVTNLVDNVASDVALLTIDSTAPEITCVSGQEFNADETHYYTVQDTEFDPVETSDNCGVESVVNDFNYSSSLAGEEIPEGTTTIIWTLTDNAGNENACSFDVLVNMFVAISTLQQQGVKIYPNPATDELNVEFADSNNIQKITISDISGRLMLNKTDIQAKERIDLSKFPDGIYLVSLKIGNEVFTTKIVKN